MNSKNALKYLLVATTGIVAAASPSFAEVVYSQNFDGSASSTVDIAPGGFGFSERSWGSYNEVGSLPLGWSISCNNLGDGCGVLAFVGSTPAGDHQFDFDGHTGILLNEEPGSANSILTTITGLNAGQTYTLSFQYWGDNNPTPSDNAYPFNAIVDGVATSFSGNDLGPPPDGSYNTGTVSFVAVGGSDTLQFVETTPTNDEASVILDNISISDSPEPGTFGMLFLASGILAWGWNKRSRRA